MKALQFLALVALLGACKPDGTDQVDDLSGTYTTQYQNEFAEVRDTMVISALSQPGAYQIAQHGVIKRVVDGKKYPDEHKKVPARVANFDAGKKVLIIGQEDIYTVNAGQQSLTLGKTIYRKRW